MTDAPVPPRSARSLGRSPARPPATTVPPSAPFPTAVAPERPATPAELARALRTVRQGIADACRRAGRDPSEVRLVAATKGVPIELVRWARDLGVDQFGENYARPLAEKATEVSATWHFFGKLQRGTVARVARHADVVHGGEPGSAIERLAARVSSQDRIVECLAQVDFAGRGQGVHPEELEPFLASASGLEGVRWVGLMTLPPWTGSPEGARPYFAELRLLRDRLRVRWPGLRELSMGMSGDYEVAVEEGATMVRLGTALFGERPRGWPGVP